MHYYLGCTVDHEDNSKKWCSTKVDSNSNHIVNQNEYGYCADNCPISSGKDLIIDETTAKPIQDNTNSTGISIVCYMYVKVKYD